MRTVLPPPTHCAHLNLAVALPKKLNQTEANNKQKKSHRIMGTIKVAEKHTGSIKQENLRSQLDLEKNKLEQALKSQHYTGNADPSSYHPVTTVYARAHPRVDRRAATLFDVHKDDVFTGKDNKLLNEPVTREFHSEPAVEEWGSEALKEESFSILDEQQVAYLRALDNYIDELREQLDILQMHDMRDDAKPERQPPIDEIEGRINELQMKSDSMFVNIQGREGDLGEENLDTTSQVSVNVEEIDARNKQRLKRLEAMQLLNDIDLDPEMVLERFMTKNIQPVNRSVRY
ncbi:unnamed protein product [Calicophoron daubneyi]|uniref:Uncharacterized protein n=1 Tax=Calicophoron daubneyi TaxID=300641 RepID=A0AAV2TFS0_CALDB